MKFRKRLAIFLSISMIFSILTMGMACAEENASAPSLTVSVQTPIGASDTSAENLGETPGNTPDEEPNGEPDGEPDNTPDGKPGEKSDEEPGNKPDEESDEEPGDKPDEESDEEPGNKPDGESDEEPGGKPDKESNEKPGDKPDGESNEEPGEKPDEESDETPFDPATAFEEIMVLETDAEREAYIATLTKEEYAALKEYVRNEAELTFPPPVTVPFTNAGPLLPPIIIGNPSRTRKPASRSRSDSKDTDEEDALVLDKKAAANGDTYTVTLESFTTGQVTDVTQSVPCDIILVLDQSGSMADDFKVSETSVTTRQAAMKSSVCDFIEDVAEKYTEEGNHRIGIVTFANGASTRSNLTYVDEAGETGLTTSINSLPYQPSGATNVAAGMTTAQSMFDSDIVTGTRQRVVIVFTDGVPTTSSEFSISVADEAILTGKAMKDEGVTIYTIGIFNGANKYELYGGSSGTPGSSWGGYYYQSPVAVPAANRFMNYLSSNYPTADTVGLSDSWEGGWNWFEWYVTYTITTNYARVADTYYLTAEDQTSLNNIFTSISTQISTPNITLGANTVVRDVVSQYFDIPEIGDISVYTADYQGGDSWAESEVATGVTVNIDPVTQTVDFSGFDFDSNYVTETARDESFYGRKLIIEMTLSPKLGFAGGNQVPTNTDTSGLYTTSDAPSPVEAFPVPTVDVPISFDFTTNDKFIYLCDGISASDLYTSVDMTGWQYDFVEDASYTVSPEISDTSSANYNITATVSPLYSGTYNANTVTRSASVHVFVPTITYKDSIIYLGESADYEDNYVSVGWLCGEDIADTTTMGPPPCLSYQYSPEAALFTGDTDIEAAVFLDEIDITEHVNFAWLENSDCTCTEGPDGAQFRVHVKTCSLTVSKTGASSLDENQCFIFHVTGTPETYNSYIDLTVVVQGNGDTTICGLPIGSYTITEDSKWSWRYSNGSSTATLSSECNAFTVPITNSRVNIYWLNGCSKAINDFLVSGIVRNTAFPANKQN